MLRLYLTLFAILFLAVHAEANEDKGFSVAVQTLQTLVEARCLKNANESALEELKNTTLGVKTCLTPMHQPQPHDDEGLFNLVCVEIADTAFNCIGDVLQKLKPCLNHEEQFFPNFLINSFNSSFNEECNAGVANIVELVSNIQTSVCIKSVETVKTKLVENCLPYLTLFGSLDKPNFVLSKSVVCNDLENVLDCAIEVFKEVCEDEVFEKLLVETLKPHLIWCDEHTENVS